jgi:hypothetical protein
VNGAGIEDDEAFEPIDICFVGDEVDDFPAFGAEPSLEPLSLDANVPVVEAAGACEVETVAVGALAIEFLKACMEFAIEVAGLDGGPLVATIPFLELS